MDVRITPGRLGGTFRALPSKSEAHRALILAALSDAPTSITGVGGEKLSDDVVRTVGAVRALGAKVEPGGGMIEVTPPEEYNKLAVIDCGESGSTLRFMVPVCAALGGLFRFVRHGRLIERPLFVLGEAIRSPILEVFYQGDDVWVSGKLTPRHFSMPGNESSQYVTGILLALSVCGGCVGVPGDFESKPYVELTVDMMEKFGVRVVCGNEEQSGYPLFTVERRERSDAGGNGGTPAARREIAIGGDWSGAANLIAAGASALGLDPSSAQGDRAILRILSDMGASVSTDGGAVAVRFGGAPEPIDADMRDTPDLVPLIAVLCAAANGVSVLRGTRRLRFKESDRVASTLALLGSLGVCAEASEDEITVRGGAIRGGDADSFGDHRIAMAAAVASAFADGEITVRGAECVSKSYPGFWETFCSLGGRYTEI